MWLRKFTAIFNITLKESLAYRFNAITGALFSFLKIVLAYLLWSAVFGEKEYIGSFTFPMMVSYYLVVTLMERLAKSEGIIWEISDEVRTGSYTKYLTRPLRHFPYCFARSLGKGMFSLIIDLIAFAAWALIFRKSLYFPSDLFSILCFSGFTLLGLYTWLQIHYVIGLISFKTIDIAGPYFLATNFIGFMAGSFIPLALLPPTLGKILAYTPFYYLLNYPAMLFLGQGKDQLYQALGVVLFWNLFLMLFRSFFYRKMVKLYEGVGG